MSDTCWTTAIDLAAAIRDGEVSPVEVIDAALRRLDRLNPRLNAVVTRDDDAARAVAQALLRRRDRGEELGPLAGAPLLVKDLHLTAGLRTTFGSRIYESFVPQRDCPLVARLRAAGAIVVGKTNTSEFGYLPLSGNPLFGETLNPWNAGFDAGGSSGGSAAAVAAGLAPLATGSDGGGSIRVPAAWCGVFGLKPQLGRIPRGFHDRGWETLSHDGPIARSVRDAARVLDIANGYDPSDRWSLPRYAGSFEQACDDPPTGLRLAWCARWGRVPVDEEVFASCREAALRFRELGCQVEELELDWPDLGPAQQTIVLAETWTQFGERRDPWEQLVDPRLARMLDKGARLSVAEVQRAQWAREAFWERMAEVLERFDAVAAPVTSIVGAAAGGLGPRAIAGQPTRALAWLAFCVPANLTGQPACSLPIGAARSGLPLGLQLMARPHDEATLLRLAAGYERAFPWSDRRPPGAESPLSTSATGGSAT